MAHQHPLLVRLGASIRLRREADGLRRRDLAERAGVSERFLVDIEGGRANPSILRLLGLAEALDTTLPELIGAASPIPRHVALLGLRGAGKSTIGPRLAERLGYPFVELDARIQDATGLQLGEIFQFHGEAYYRVAEREALQRALAGESCVLAPSGGIVADPTSFGLLRAAARTVWLKARPEDHWERVIAQGDTRPMADRDRAFADLRRILDEREPLYRLADRTVDTSGLSIGEVVETVFERVSSVG